MKKFTKIMLILSAAVACLGAICMVIAFAMGLTADGLKQMVKDGKFAFDMNDVIDMKEVTILEISDDDEMTNDDTDSSVMPNVNIEEETNGDEKIYKVFDTFENLDVEFGAGVLDIYYDDVETIQIKEKNIDELKVNIKNNTLVIENGLKVNVGDVDDLESRSLVIVIPTDRKFDGIELEIGATQADIEGLSASAIDITIGAGEATISNITADSMELEVGAGEATIVNLAVEKMDMEVGMGQVDLGLYGAQTDYSYNVECGMGNVVVGDDSYGGFGVEHHAQSHHSQTHHTSKSLNIECGMGEVHVKFHE